MCLRRMRSVAEDVEAAADLLRRAAQHARTDPEHAYALLHPNGQGAISGLGPAFGTKFLYFAGRGDPDHPSLILDSRVATTLHHHGWTSLGTGGAWPPPTYGRYVTLARRWADELTRLGGQRVAADQVELWLFRRR